MENYFPFSVSEEGNESFAILAAIESDELYPKYYDFFAKFGYEGNGYCWEGHIVQILEKIDPSLLSHLDFDPEAGGFFAYADSKETQLKTLQILAPIFSDLNILEEWVKKTDRERIDD